MNEPDATQPSPLRRDSMETRTSASAVRRSGARPADEALPEFIGRYEIVEELGRGGMGVVYRARDTRLDRIVALKALPARVAADPETRSRFEREARLLAALEHPHVAAIYGIEEARGGAFLVLQYVEGESLAASLRHGPLPLEHALEVAVQVASGVAAAHRRDIVHCDLKPANVMVASDGTVKLVDFGIATRFRGSALGDAGTSPMVYGTPAYMSPEQIHGRALDPRTDIWSFGCTLFECLAGALPFGDADQPSLLTRIENLPPDWSLLPANLPPALRTLLEECLVKQRESRPADMDAVRLRLASLLRPAPSAPRPSLPQPISAFIGRTRELAEIEALIASERLVTLTGSAGCGKTRLALEAARRVESSLRDGAWFVSLAPLQDGGHVATALMAALGIVRDTTHPDVSIISALREKEGLLILDNCEHLLRDVAQLVEKLLSQCPGLRVACTSREALGIPGECAWRVPSLDMPAGDGATAASLEATDAAALFVARAREVRPDFRLDDASARPIAALLARLDGIPLAIELAAARLRILTPDQILERLSDRFRLLTGGSRTALERHQTLRAALEWSYGLLGDDDKLCLRELSVFAGGFRLEEAVSTCTGDEFEVLDRVSSLVAKSLVQAEGDGRHAPRYRLLESIRQHAAAKLDDAGEAEAVRDRHLATWVAFARTARADREGDDPSLQSRIEREHDNLRAALEWALSKDATTPEAMALGSNLATFWEQGGHWRDGLSFFERILAAPGFDEATRDGAFCISGLGRMKYGMGDLDGALAAYSRALALFESLGDRKARAASRMEVNLITHVRGRLREAREVYLSVIDEARDCGNRHLEVETLLNLGVIERDLGMPQDAQAHVEAALALGGTRREARSHRLLGVLARDRGDLARARQLLERSVALHESRAERQDAMGSRVDLAHVAVVEGRLDEARELFAMAESAYRKWGDQRGRVLALGNLGVVEGRLGNLEAAHLTLASSLRLVRGTPNRLLLASVTSALARVMAPDEPALSARVLGCVDATRAAMGRQIGGAELAEHDELRARLRETLGNVAFEESHAAGAASLLEDIADELLAAPGN